MYENLTLNQKMNLKNEIEINPVLQRYKLLMKVFNFKLACNYFLTDDDSILYKAYKKKYN